MIVNDMCIVRVRDFEATPSNVRFSIDCSFVTMEETVQSNVFTNKPLTPDEIALAVWTRAGRTLT